MDNRSQSGILHFLRCVGRALLKNSGRALASLAPFGDVAYEIARDTYEEYRRDNTEAELRADLLELAQATAADIRQAAETVAAQEASDQSTEACLVLEEKLARAPELAALLERAPLPPAPHLTLTGRKRSYHLRELIAAGDASDVHLACSAKTDGPEQEPRYIVKVARTPEGSVLLEREHKTLTRLLTRAGDTTYRRYLPTLAESFLADSHKRVNVFLHEPGLYTLEQIHHQHPALDGRHLAWIYKRLLTVLGFVHRQGSVHGAVLPCHVLLHAASHGLQLVGWGQSVPAGRPITTIIPRHASWYPPEVRSKQAALPGTDVFLATRCLIYLAGGDPVEGRMPDTVPTAMQRFLTTCLLEGVKMRPDDAWALLEDFDALLRRLYGPPRFHELTMT